MVWGGGTTGPIENKNGSSIYFSMLNEIHGVNILKNLISHAARLGEDIDDVLFFCSFLDVFKDKKSNARCKRNINARLVAKGF